MQNNEGKRVNQANIQYLKIANFKSIDSLELRNINDFSVFAGANGSGKSNFFDALDFVSRFMRHGITASVGCVLRTIKKIILKMGKGQVPDAC